MKIVLFTLIMLTSFSNCEQERMQMHYLAQSRGFFLEIQIQSSLLKVTDQRGGESKERKLSNTELEDLKSLLTKIDFDNTEVPDTSKSTYDAAARAKLTLLIDGEIHEFDFDHGYPPNNLKVLVNKIITLSEIVE